MAVYATRLSVQDAAFPLLSRYAGRGVFIPNMDTHTVTEPAPSGLGASAMPAFYGVTTPHVVYCENVLPRNGGLNSVGYVQFSTAGAIDPNPIAFAVDLVVRDTMASPAVSKTLLLLVSKVQRRLTYILADGTRQYVYPTLSFSNAWTNVSFGTFLGKTFCMYNGAGVSLMQEIVYFDTVVGPTTFKVAALTATTPAGIATVDYNLCKYMCGAGNYTILAKEDGTIYWTDPNNLLDFTPSLITGAGFLVPSSMNGTVIGLASVGDGFLVHTTGGSILARYSQNAQNPWIFTPVANSEPINRCPVNGLLAASNPGTGSGQFCWTNSGLQEISILSGAVSVFPEVSDFIAGELLETLYPDLLTGIPTTMAFKNTASPPVAIDVGTIINCMITKIGFRYLCISLGHNIAVDTYNPYPFFTQALIYDINLKRWGKLNKRHVSIVEIPVDYIGNEAVHTIGLVDIDGTLYNVSEEGRGGTGAVPVEHAGVIVVGGISFVRGNVCTLQGVSANFGNLVSATPATSDREAVTCHHAPSKDAINSVVFAPLEVIETSIGTSSWGARKTDKYHTLKFHGYFKITDVEVSLTKAGFR